MAPSTPKPPSDDAAMRKKKNADAQAAFRARRANYIATLEEAVTNLESVVLQLQESCREAKAEATQLGQENDRLRHASKEREKFWRALWQQSRKSNGHSDSHSDDFPHNLQPPYASSMQSNGATLTSPVSPSHMHQYGDQTMSARYPPGRDPSGSMSNNFNPGTGHEYPNRSPTITFATSDTEHGSMDTRPNSMQSQRVSKYGSYPQTYDVDGHVRDATWTQSITHASISNTDTIHHDSGSSSHSPAFVESSSNLTSPEMSYMPRYPVEDQKMPLTSLDTTTAPYVFSNNRPLSPSASTSSSASSTMTSPFQFQFTDSSVPQERPEFNFRRHSTGAGPELTLHGGTAHISLENDRYRMSGVRRPANGIDSQPFPVMPPPNPEQPSHEHDSGETEAAPYYHVPQPLARRSTTTSRTSRSPSPGTPPICGTLAVIKAQAFGALRRTRTKTKKGSEGAAKAALEALEARGIGVGMSSITKSNKRPRLDEDDDDDDDGDFRP